MFEEETNVKAGLNENELQEFQQLMVGCNPGLFQAEFVKALERIKGQPIPAHLKRPEDLCMTLAIGCGGNGAKKWG